MLKLQEMGILIGLWECHQPSLLTQITQTKNIKHLNKLNKTYNQMKQTNKNTHNHGNGQNGIFTCVLHQFIYPCWLQTGYLLMLQLVLLKVVISGSGFVLLLLGSLFYYIFGLLLHLGFALLAILLSSDLISFHFYFILNSSKIWILLLIIIIEKVIFYEKFDKK